VCLERDQSTECKKPSTVSIQYIKRLTRMLLVVGGGGGGMMKADTSSGVSSQMPDCIGACTTTVARNSSRSKLLSSSSSSMSWSHSEFMLANMCLSSGGSWSAKGVGGLLGESKNDSAIWKNILRQPCQFEEGQKSQKVCS